MDLLSRYNTEVVAVMPQVVETNGSRVDLPVFDFFSQYSQTHIDELCCRYPILLGDWKTSQQGRFSPVLPWFIIPLTSSIYHP